MKFSKYLKEERISSKVKRSLLATIKHPKKNVIVVGDKEVIVTPIDNGGVSFTFDKDMYELSMTITDIVDTLDEYTQKSQNKGDKVVFTVIR
jgi:ArsR family metal-binding transcriptional regulator